MSVKIRHIRHEQVLSEKVREKASHPSHARKKSEEVCENPSHPSHAGLIPVKCHRRRVFATRDKRIRPYHAPGHIPGMQPPSQTQSAYRYTGCFR